VSLLPASNPGDFSSQRATKIDHRWVQFPLGEGCPQFQLVAWGNGVGSHLRRNETRRISVASLRLGPQCLDRFDRALYEDLAAFRADATASPGRPKRRRPDP